MLELQKGGAALIGGEKELKIGAMQLSDGMKAFNNNGVKKLTEVYDGDVSAPCGARKSRHPSLPELPNLCRRVR